MSKRIILRLAVCAAVLAGLIVGGRYLNLTALMRDALAWIQSLGIWAPVAFIVIYAVSCVLAIPASILTLGGGFLFGFAGGVLYVVAGALLGAVAAFLVGRYFARDWVARKIERHERFRAIDDAIAREGWKIVLLARLAPIFPYAVLNYGFALTRVSLRHYTTATAVGILPAMMVFVYFGTLATDVAKLGQGVKSNPALKWSIAVIAVIAVVLLARIARRALNRALNNQPQ
ncbi:MAG: TVP38/TMEM64 family protein [Verrucomicrobia subdivision 3 bacterium]|nr:TVP38/TMEM64 family protein [Limisphaerales bacterium]